MAIVDLLGLIAILAALVAMVAVYGLPVMLVSTTMVRVVELWLRRR